MDSIIRKINSGGIMDFDEACGLFAAMADGGLTDAQIASVLISLRFRGEQPDEFAALIKILGERKKKFHHNEKNTVDTCGTGGDGKSTVNVSTAAGIILASMGCKVVKHGNSAQSGKVGSADILARLGFDMGYAGTSPEEFFAKNKFVFMFAPDYHPALKAIGRVRREIKVATIFNLAGPMLNPAEPDYQVIGISSVNRLGFMAEAAIKNKRDNVTFYSSRDGFDEVSSKEPTDCLAVRGGAIEKFSIDPADFFTPFDMPVINSADEAEFLFIEGISGRDEKTAQIFALNAALALKTMNEFSLEDGFSESMRAISSGTAASKLIQLTGGLNES